MATIDTNFDSIFGKVVIEQKLCTEEELRHSQGELKTRQPHSPTTLPAVMVELGYLTKSQAERIRSAIIKRNKDAITATHQIPGYHVLGKLGAGAMAVVYKATQLSLNRTVAIKILPKRFTESPDYVTRFYKEGRAAAKLNHNNIVQAIDVGEAGGYHYFVMEYVEGKTIYDDLATGKIFRENDALDTIIQVSQALKHAHAKGLIHRDVKPKNIMINTAGVVKLADMGLARETADLEAAESEAGKAFGTPYYIAPEQIRGEVNIDGRADIYSLGCTLYHMVTGRVPFESPNPADVMRKHLREPMIPPDHINTALSAGISEVIEVMMAKNRDNRYANMDEVLTDLQSVRNGEPPLQARRKFNVDGLQVLQDGHLLEPQNKEKVYKEETIVRYKVVILLLGSVIAALTLIIIFMLLR